MRIDVNSDLGESFGQWELGDDTAMLSIITSANIACGFHAGDPSVLRSTCERAVHNGVAIGAQVGYRDLAGFGRRFIDVAPHDLTNDVLYQLGALEAMAHTAGDRIRYVKPHGALYNAVVSHEEQAVAVVRAVQLYNPALPVLGLPGSVWLRHATEAGIPTVYEAFADRAYTPEGTLVSRQEPDAVLHDAEHIAQRCLTMVAGEQVTAVDGSRIRITADSLCVHGDSAGAVTIAQAVVRRLRAEGVELESFTAARSHE